MTRGQEEEEELCPVLLCVSTQRTSQPRPTTPHLLRDPSDVNHICVSAPSQRNARQQFLETVGSNHTNVSEHHSRGSVTTTDDPLVRLSQAGLQLLQRRPQHEGTRQEPGAAPGEGGEGSPSWSVCQVGV